ncbi:MAG TPA: NIPSNAP family protein [Stellaceae bacterium]|nr:NIPSNAP family protein [Stellaceae bacterium]
MIFEMRTYRLQPGSVPAAEERFEEGLKERVKVSPLGAFFHTEVGPLNHVIHIWPYEDLAHRTRVRAEKIPGWPPKIQEFIVEMESKIFNAAPFCPAFTPRQYGGLYEIRTYTMLPGATQEVIDRWAEVIEGRTRLSPLAACGYTELGPLNQWIHIWAYKDAAERFRIREESRKGGKWPPATRGKFVRQENMLVVPASFSPLC